MPTFFEFDLIVLILLVLTFVLLIKAKWNLTKKYEVAIFLTILIYRLSTIIYLILGGNFGTHTNNNSIFDHKFVGMIIVGLVLLYWPKKKMENTKAVLLGVSTGQIIDEVSEVLELLGIKFPVNFRDSLPDLILIALSFFGFVYIRRLLIKSGGKPGKGV